MMEKLILGAWGILVVLVLLFAIVAIPASIYGKYEVCSKYFKETPIAICMTMPLPPINMKENK